MYCSCQQTIFCGIAIDKHVLFLSTNSVSCRIAIDAMKGFLERVGSLDLMEALDKEEMWDKITDEVEYPEAITILARSGQG